MKKKLFYMISIFILCFSFAFSFFDKFSFAADSVTYVVVNSSGSHGTFECSSSFRPFLIKAHIIETNQFNTYLIVANQHNVITKFSGWLSSYIQNGSLDDGTKFEGIVYWGSKDIIQSVQPSIPVIEKDFNKWSVESNYISSLLRDPSQLPINVTSYDSSLGSLVLSSDNDYKFLSVMLNSTTIKNRFFTANFSDKTSNNKSFDKIQCMISLNNIYSKNFIGSSVPSDWNYSEGTELRSILPTLYDKNIKVDLLSLKDGTGNDSLYSFGIFQGLLDKHNINVDGLFGGALVFDYTLFFRPVTSSGSYGDWISFTPEAGFDNDNLYKTSGGLSTLINYSKSSSNPTSTDYNFLGNSTSSKTAIGFGSDYDSAVADSNNTFINNYNGSDDSLITNIKGLFSYFVGLPDIVSTIFSWLPSWVLSLFAIGFALFVPIFIYKFVRG